MLARMPEGDTIRRTAVTLAEWLNGRTIRRARTTAAAFPAGKVVGQTVTAVEAEGKHLLIRLSGGQVIHTHMKMTGVWHVYEAGARWRRSPSRARLVLETDDHVAVCFNAPVVELLAPKGEYLHRSLTGLGPDVLEPPVDLDEVRRRTAAVAAELTIGELLLDQRVVAGIGNIWRCETLFACRVDPFRPQATVDLEPLVTTASDLMTRSVAGDRPRAMVYGRARRPCRRCGTPISSAPLGRPPRTIYWCPACQAASE